MKTVHGRTKLVVSFKRNVGTSKCLAHVLPVQKFTEVRKPQEFAELVEAQFKRDTTKLKFNFSKLHFSFLICIEKAKLEIMYSFLPISHNTSEPNSKLFI